MISIHPGSVQGCLQAPASKSHLQRLLLAASQAQGESTLLHPGHSEDGQACIRIIRGLGSQVEEREDRLIVRGQVRSHESILDCGESGFCLRAASALAALDSRPVTLLGRGSLASRPMQMVAEGLEAQGISCQTREGKAPLKVQGSLLGGKVCLDGSASSQFLSGLLLALPQAPRDSEVEVRNLRSRPYVRMTLEVLEAFGIRVDAEADLRHFRIPGRQVFRPGCHPVEGDWSGAAFLLVAGALAGEIALRGLNPHSSQADRAILEALRLAGLEAFWQEGTLILRSAELMAFHFDASDCPDLFPPLAALACHARGTSRIFGVDRLRHKESDRAAALLSELGKMGARIQIRENAIEITGGPLEGGSVDSHQDHRIAMACAVAALGSKHGAEIHGEACVAKSYPGFWEDLAKLREANQI